MKNFLKKLLVLGAILSATTATINIIPHNTVFADGATSATGRDCSYFIGMVSWDCGLKTIDSEEKLKDGIWVIVANILTDISVIAAYLVVGYVIYGGYLYMFSSGDPGKASAGKKTLSHAFIGLAIVSLANIIINAIRFALLKTNSNDFSNCADNQCIDASSLILNTISWVIAIAGLVASVFIVIGGVGYMTSSGDPSKLKKAKDTLLYALIGLAIVALSGVIVSVVSGIINDSKTARQINQTTIAKEYHEN